MRFSFPEQRAKWNDSGFTNLEPCDFWAERYGCFNSGSSPSGGGSSEPRGVAFGVDGRSVTGSTKADREIGYSDGAGGRGANFDQMSQASSSDIRAAVDAANEAAREGRNTVSAALSAFGGGGDDYGIGSQGEFSTAAMAAPSVAPPAVATGNYDDSAIRFAQNQMGAGARPEARVTRRPTPSRDLMTVFPGVLGQSIFASSQGRSEPIERGLAVTALQDRALAGDADAQMELDDLQKRGAVTTQEASYVMDKIAAQNAAQINADRILNQAPVTSAAATPIQVAMGTGRPTTPDTVYDINTSVPSGNYGGYEDDVAYDADIFGTPRYAGGQVGLDGNLQGFANARQMGDFVDQKVAPSPLQSLITSGPIPTLLNAVTGFSLKDTVQDYNRDKIREQLEGGATYNPETEQLEGGTVQSRTAPQIPSGGGGGGYMPPPMIDPCPEGYKLVNGVCQPIEDASTDMAADTGSTNVATTTPAAALPTSFSPFTQATPVGTVNPFVLQPTRFAEGGSVPRATEIAGQPHMLSYITPGEAEVLKSMGGAGEPGPGGIPAYFYDEVGAVSGTTGNIGSGGQNQDFTQGDDDNDTQTVIATPINTQGDDEPYQITDAQANQMNQQTQLNQAAIDAQNQKQQTEAQMRNQQIQGNIDRLNQMRQDLNAPSQPGLANTILQGALDIFTSPATTPDPSAAVVQPNQNLPMNPNANIQGQFGDVSKQGQVQAPAGLGSIVPSADQAVSGVNQGQFTNVMPESGGFSIPSPEEFRANLGLPDDVPGAIGDFLSGLKQSVVGNPNKIADNFQNFGQLGQSDRMYGTSNYQGTGSSFNPFR